jgi:hypothetical protein
MHAKWSFALAHALALRKVRIVNLLALYLTAMFIESPRVLDYALDRLDLPHCCSTTQSILDVQFIVGEHCYYQALLRLVVAVALAGGVAAALGQHLLCLHLLCVCPKLVWYATCVGERESEPRLFSFPALPYNARHRCTCTKRNHRGI